MDFLTGKIAEILDTLLAQGFIIQDFPQNLGSK